ncbi:hypothetical protein E2N92_09525 [Methanofollis formosanus]|uniref:Uncharacterized protein n=1 Tax=Methanofollis formosanus TaxID=299308 RepID=A0A8G1A3A6_9EURY|nr:hypothetical protein [Methanofollis formosanus]QYZ79653.1 hypothetical protein E2N92_09525 [Methanofollis formosanus]
MRIVWLFGKITDRSVRSISCIFSALLLFAYLVPTVAATNMAAKAAESSNQDLFTLFIAGVIYINVLAVVISLILRRGKRVKGRSTLVRVTGVSAGILSVAAGSIFMISAIFVALGHFGGVTLFAWTWDFLGYLITDVVPATTGVIIPSMTVALLIIGAAGVLVFLLGTMLIVRYGGEEIFSEVATPTRSGASMQHGGVDKIPEPLNPVLSFKVDIRRTDEPAADMKVVLRHRNGLNVRSKFTDYNGEVSFTNVEGFGSDYYAYVEGDENREIYRVIRT